MVTVYFVRHCAAQGNVDGKFQGRIDCDITDLGRKQLDLLAVRLRNVPFAAVYTSPLVRARKTAEAVLRYHEGVPLYIEPGLIEIALGKIAGMDWHEFPNVYPEAADAWYHPPWDFKAPDGESMKDVWDRVWGAVHEIIEKENEPGREKTLCLVTHGCALRNYLCRAKGLPIERFDEVPLTDNTGICKVRYDDAGVPEVLVVGDASHLTPELSVAKKMGWGAKKA